MEELKKATEEMNELLGNHDPIAEEQVIDGLCQSREILSNCCSAPIDGEMYDGIGRCSSCKEMASFDPSEL
jgi:hypothetical protein